MKIIREGNLEAAKEIKRFECASCKCIFEADRDEYSRQVGSFNETMLTAKCPCCDKKAYEEE